MDLLFFLTLDKTVHTVDFVVSRFFRLYPAYWSAVIITFSVIYVFSLPGREVNIDSALINLTMIQTWLRVDNVDGVYWTLAVEQSIIRNLDSNGMINTVSIIIVPLGISIAIATLIAKVY